MTTPRSTPFCSAGVQLGAHLCGHLTGVRTCVGELPGLRAQPTGGGVGLGDGL
jgi:hypothetical protein